MNMKVTDLTLTLFKWKSELWRTGGTAFGGEVDLGIVTVSTDEGLEGHSFLGSSRQGADEFSVQLMRSIKPLVIGKDPLFTTAIWEIPAALMLAWLKKIRPKWSRSGNTSSWLGRLAPPESTR